MGKRLYKVRQGRRIAGVCGGLACYFGVEPKVVRLLFALFIAVYGSGLMAYLLLAVFLPQAPEEGPQGRAHTQG